MVSLPDELWEKILVQTDEAVSCQNLFLALNKSTQKNIANAFEKHFKKINFSLGICIGKQISYFYENYLDIRIHANANITLFRFIPDTTKYVVVTEDNLITFYDKTEPKKPINGIKNAMQKQITSMEIDKTGSTMVTGYDNYIRIWDLTVKKPKYNAYTLPIIAHRFKPMKIEFHQSKPLILVSMFCNEKDRREDFCYAFYFFIVNYKTGEIISLNNKFRIAPVHFSLDGERVIFQQEAGFGSLFIDSKLPGQSIKLPYFYIWDFFETETFFYMACAKHHPASEVNGLLLRFKQHDAEPKKVNIMYSNKSLSLWELRINQDKTKVLIKDTSNIKIIDLKTKMVLQKYKDKNPEMEHDLFSRKDPKKTISTYDICSF